MDTSGLPPKPPRGKRVQSAANFDAWRPSGGGSPDLRRGSEVSWSSASRSDRARPPSPKASSRRIQSPESTTTEALALPKLPCDTEKEKVTQTRAMKAQSAVNSDAWASPGGGSPNPEISWSSASRCDRARPPSPSSQQLGTPLSSRIKSPESAKKGDLALPKTRLSHDTENEKVTETGAMPDFALKATNSKSQQTEKVPFSQFSTLSEVPSAANFDDWVPPDGGSLYSRRGSEVSWSSASRSDRTRPPSPKASSRRIQSPESTTKEEKEKVTETGATNSFAKSQQTENVSSSQLPMRAQSAVNFDAWVPPGGGSNRERDSEVSWSSASRSDRARPPSPSSQQLGTPLSSRIKSPEPAKKGDLALKATNSEKLQQTETVLARQLGTPLWRSKSQSPEPTKEQDLALPNTRLSHDTEKERSTNFSSQKPKPSYFFTGIQPNTLHGYEQEYLSLRQFLTEATDTSEEVDMQSQILSSKGITSKQEPDLEFLRCGKHDDPRKIYTPVDKSASFDEKRTPKPDKFLSPSSLKIPINSPKSLFRASCDSPLLKSQRRKKEKSLSLRQEKEESGVGGKLDEKLDGVGRKFWERVIMHFDWDEPGFSVLCGVCFFVVGCGWSWWYCLFLSSPPFSRNMGMHSQRTSFPFSLQLRRFLFAPSSFPFSLVLTSHFSGKKTPLSHQVYA